MDKGYNQMTYSAITATEQTWGEGQPHLLIHSFIHAFTLLLKTSVCQALYKLLGTYR